MDEGRKEPKLFNDPIYGTIEIHTLCAKIIDTPEFQRLRGIKQLGGCSYVYPGGVHTRFDHSIGVCYLAGQLVMSLRDHQPGLDIKPIDVLCVEIAGLCHDLGYGPFSHIFDDMVIPLLFEGDGKGDLSPYKHVAFSEVIFKHLLENNDLIGEFEKEEYGLTKDRRDFIVDLFSGRRSKDYEFLKGNGDTKDKFFLFEIVKNKRTGIDVDQWDLFARDCHMLGFKNNFIHQRTILLTRAIEGEKLEGKSHYEICFRDKEAISLYDMFYSRQSLRRKAHEHKVVKAVEYMIADAIFEASKSDRIRFQGEQLRSLKEVIEERDLKAYCLLTDHIIEQIRYVDQADDNIMKAREILKKLDTRKLYKHAAEHCWTKDKKEKVDAIKGAIENLCRDRKGSIKVDTVYFDFGRDDKSPIDDLWFYDKSHRRIRVPKEKLSHLLPETFQEQLIRVYCTETDDKENVKKAFEHWLKDAANGHGVHEHGVTAT